MSDTPGDRPGQSAHRRARRRRRPSQAAGGHREGGGADRARASGAAGTTGGGDLKGAGGSPDSKARGGSGSKPRGGSGSKSRGGSGSKAQGGSGSKAQGGSGSKAQSASGSKSRGGSSSKAQSGRSARRGGRAAPSVPAAATLLGTMSDPFAADRRNEARVGANRRRTSVIAGSSALLPAVVVGVVLGIVVGIVVGAVVAAVVFVCTTAVLVRWALRIALAVIGGRAVRDDELPALANQVDGLSATVGVRRPRLWVVDDEVPNACALSGRRDARAVLVVTTGLLGILGIIELEGVLAHELVHMKREDATVSAVAVATVGLVSAAFAGDGLLHQALGHGREYEADQAAALALRYPPGLQDALGALGGHASAPGTSAGERSPFHGWRWTATRWIWVDPMVGTTGPAERSPIGELDATDVRAEALAQW